MTDLDELMSRDPLSLSDQDIESIIARHRNQRARKASGEKISKPAVNLDFILNKLQITKSEENPQPTIKRRI
jgi:hypothetical protein